MAGRQSPDPEETRALKRALLAVLRLAREARGLSQEQAAERVGITVEFYARVERGQALPGMVNLVRMADALEIPVDSMLPQGEPPVTKPEHPPSFDYIVERWRNDRHAMRAVTAILAAFEHVEQDPDESDE